MGDGAGWGRPTENNMVRPLNLFLAVIYAS